jgi:hypothetical protein
MRARVLRSFIDKHTKEVHKVDDVITVTKARFAEILKAGPLVEAVKEEKQEKETE